MSGSNQLPYPDLAISIFSATVLLNTLILIKACVILTVSPTDLSKPVTLSIDSDTPNASDTVLAKVLTVPLKD